ncbi:ribbon-helix-helix protein, CopG family [Streptomyces sp. NBC_01537]|uniref:ribbon-helix-helix protein, CopG family n=1 Tax=Streptomyces sp. NBC_01537 TaxID=2903896 RepID=UPI00386E0B03
MSEQKLFTRLSVNLNDEAARALKENSDRRGISITEAVRRAIAVYDFIERETAAGNRIQVVDPEGRVRELLLV